jgi:uncharacterized protein YaaW (UPF0174 family)
MDDHRTGIFINITNRLDENDIDEMVEDAIQYKKDLFVDEDYEEDPSYDKEDEITTEVLEEILLEEIGKEATKEMDFRLKKELIDRLKEFYGR